MIKSRIFIGSKLLSDFELALVLLDNLVLVIIGDHKQAIESYDNSPHGVYNFLDFGNLLILFLFPDLRYLFGLSEEYNWLFRVLQSLQVFVHF